ncbi:Uncharacterised protein [Yersinia ruckeri]|uniref:hypothetical protein n=1 Tax=Yersinia ruckeri TaxID=29486 RepID=UPI0005E8F9E9|nr:hypothetical protein [Yersinia ruckeri]ELI6452499.1 hypothetical protein [Yersinia ruckeri]CNB91403.1 Uncharacterised protein [Yersinia ruckeri]
MTIVSVGRDLVEEIIMDDALLARQVRIIDSYIVIDVSYPYNIPLAGCSTHEGILGWVWHLTEKTWMTNDVLRRFIELAGDHAGLSYRN